MEKKINTKVKPLYDRVMVERLEQETMSPKGIIIPDTAQEKPMQGIVIEVGDGAYNESGNKIPMSLKKGDKILFGKWGGNEFKIDGKEYIIMKESEILAVIIDK